jgi:hypothetical protein
VAVGAAGLSQEPRAPRRSAKKNAPFPSTKTAVDTISASGRGKRPEPDKSRPELSLGRDGAIGSLLAIVPVALRGRRRAQDCGEREKEDRADGLDRRGTPDRATPLRNIATRDPLLP